ncbi:EAL domain-containing protein [Devosia sp. WQ 349]|uniref:EAL domain-containing protein n=1 Tax=Devosia sp. WQ 349K1 TaxID=2800329 RepID=UPI0019061067|nr:EAL domain-containing protein [Devosia sp. WQ 349K1]
MKFNISHLLMLLGAAVALVPIVAVDFVIDAYVEHREKTVAERHVSVDSSTVASSASEGVAALRIVWSDSPSLCAQTFVQNAQAAVQNNVSVLQFVVENSDGTQYCDAFGTGVSYAPLSTALPIPGQSETLTVVRYGAMDAPVLKITQEIGETRKLSVFVPLLPQSIESHLRTMAPSTMKRFSLTNNQPILVLGTSGEFEADKAPDDFILAAGYASQFPIKVELAIPFDVARSHYRDLDLVFTVLAALLSGAFLLGVLSYFRRSRVPAFNLERAIERNEIKPYYQPVINLRTGDLVGCEVLCRWEKPNGRVVPPNSFIEYAENTGLAIPMTVSLMQQVRGDLSELCKTIPNFKISINLFEGHFRDGGIVEDVQAIFGNSPISYRQLVFEITERRPLRNTLAATSVISGLHALGCRLAMDDVGTGHSNLAYLATLGVDVIKIDRIFVDMIKKDTTQVPVLDGLIAMGKDLDCEIVAEGVETEEQALYLRAHGVVHAQGYIFAPALKAKIFIELATALHRSGGNARDVLARVATAN